MPSPRTVEDPKFDSRTRVNKPAPKRIFFKKTPEEVGDEQQESMDTGA